VTGTLIGGAKGVIWQWRDGDHGQLKIRGYWKARNGLTRKSFSAIRGAYVRIGTLQKKTKSVGLRVLAKV